MIYLSKGIVRESSMEKRLQIIRGRQEFLLVNMEAALWLNGRFTFSEAHSPAEERALQHLVRMGLVETEEEDSRTARYRILSRCICCPAKEKRLGMPLSAGEKSALFWVQNAGIRLSTAELIYLREHRIQPSGQLLYEENRQALIETIYTGDNIQDNILENQMESAVCRDETVRILLGLLKKKKILLL